MRREASLLMLGTTVVALVGAGCIDATQNYYNFEIDSDYINPGVFPGNYGQKGPSTVLDAGPHKPLPPVIVRLKSETPANPIPESVTTEGVVYISIGLWLPDNMTGPVPVVVDAGPYFEQGTHCERARTQPPCGPGDPEVNDTIDYPQQSTPQALKNFLPHGYAVAQIGVRGTGSSGGCMDLMGPSEMADLKQAITWLGTQPWSNGNVAMTGASYDGSTPWLVAATGIPHLKAIIPVSGLPDIFDLMFRNGSAESRGPFMHDMTYWGYGYSGSVFPDPVRKDPLLGPLVTSLGSAKNREAYQDRQHILCPEVLEGGIIGAYSLLSGDRGAAASTYWSERDYRERVLKNYKGAVFLVHGLQDWNVDPHAAIPFNVKLREAGIEVKEWYGQWGHSYPDSECDQSSPKWFTAACRLDYSEVLLRFLNKHLKGNATVDTGPDVQVQDNRGYWRNADTFPPTTVEWQSLYPAPKNQLLWEVTGQEQAVTLLPPSPAAGAPLQYVEFKSEPFSKDTRISGLPQIHLDFEVQGPGGYVGAWLFDENANGHVFDRLTYEKPDPRERPVSAMGYPQVIGHAQMDLRYYDGGDVPKPLVPGQRHVAKMEFEPLEVLIPKGHRLTLWLFQYQYPDHFGSFVPSPVKLYLSSKESVLRLPSVDVDPATIFPVPGSHFPDPANFERFHVPKPAYSQMVIPLNEAVMKRAECIKAWAALDNAQAYALYLADQDPAACAD